MDAPLSGQERPRITQGAILSKVMTSVTRIPDLGLLTLGLILVLSEAIGVANAIAYRSRGYPYRSYRSYRSYRN